jgi:hypothetical protein
MKTGYQLSTYVAMWSSPFMFLSNIEPLLTVSKFLPGERTETVSCIFFVDAFHAKT